MRRTALLGALAVALALSACGDDDEAATPGGASGAATAAASPAATATAAVTPTAAALEQALWPPPGRESMDPLRVAQTFVRDYIGTGQEPHVSPFRAGEPRAGEIDVIRTAEDGTPLETVVATLSLRQLDGEHWYVTSAQSDEVVLTSPEPLATVASPVAIEGRGRGFEGNVVLEVRAAFATEALAQEAVIAGSMAELEPFSAELSFQAPAGPTGAVVAKTGSGVASADGFAALPVRF